MKVVSLFIVALFILLMVSCKDEPDSKFTGRLEKMEIGRRFIKVKMLDGQFMYFRQWSEDYMRKPLTIGDSAIVYYHDGAKRFPESAGPVLDSIVPIKN